MKKITAAILGTVMAISLAGCRSAGPQLEKLSTEKAPDPDTVKVSDYADNLEGLEKYLVALDYIPEKTEPTNMLANVIGAKSGHRYNFIVDKSTVMTEIYEYDTDDLGEEGNETLRQRKISFDLHRQFNRYCQCTA